MKSYTVHMKKGKRDNEELSLGRKRKFKRGGGESIMDILFKIPTKAVELFF